MTNNEIVVRALANTGITALNEMQQAVLDAGTTKDMVLLSPTGSGKTFGFSFLPFFGLGTGTVEFGTWNGKAKTIKDKYACRSIMRPLSP